jgi:hypothetical protein
MVICPAVLNQGFCLIDTCQLQHDTSNFCSSCHIIFTSAAQYNAHVQTPTHQQIEVNVQWLHCVPCNKYYIQASGVQTSHENSTRHIAKVNSPSNTAIPPVVETLTPPGSVHCEVCNTMVPSNAYAQHCHTARHLARTQVFNYLNAAALTQENRNGVEVSGAVTGLDLGLRPPTQPVADPEVLEITNTSTTDISLIRARTSASVGILPGLQLWYVNFNHWQQSR